MMMLNSVVVLGLVALAGLAGCAMSSKPVEGGAPKLAGSGAALKADSSGHRWAIVLHGGAGVIPRDAPAAEVESFQRSLAAALQVGEERTRRGDQAVDVVEAVIRVLEEDPNFNAGRGAAFNEKAEHELDASIMDGRTLACGGVAGLRTVKSPIGLARLVMEKTRHVLLAGPGAEEFADAMKVERVANSYFSTPKRLEMLKDVLRERDKARSARDARNARDGTMVAHEPEAEVVVDAHLLSPGARFATVGCVVLDVRGNIAAGTSTGGLTGKRFGRVGDSPIIGAGTYASDATCGVSCTGTGEEFIRYGVAKDISARMELTGATVNQAAQHVIFKVLKPDDGGVIALSRTGEIAMVYSSDGMFRAAADSGGLRVVKIWE
ncbi:hypothetical protein BH11PLA1_BH11PLA1_02320 [soil metagenome]